MARWCARACGRDIAVPATLIAERDDLLRKREELRDELQRARDEVEAFIMRRRKSPWRWSARSAPRPSRTKPSRASTARGTCASCGRRMLEIDEIVADLDKLRRDLDRVNVRLERYKNPRTLCLDACDPLCGDSGAAAGDRACPGDHHLQRLSDPAPDRLDRDPAAVRLRGLSAAPGSGALRLRAGRAAGEPSAFSRC